MKKTAFSIVFVFVWVAIGFGQSTAPDPALPNLRIANYTMDVTLNSAKKIVSGTETLDWKNTAAQPVDTLYFHLYMNAFQDNRSTFMRESGGRLRGQHFKKGKTGFIQIKKLELPGGRNLLDSLRFVSPDDGNPDDRTVARLHLPQAVPPGNRIKLHIEFETKLPEVFARAGYYRDFFMVAQWFPKIGVIWHGKWNCHQYHATSEFFADFGSYDVTIRVPKDFKVGATGSLVSSNQLDSMRVSRFVANDVHDFAWAADKNFKIAEEKFIHKGPFGLQKVRIRLFYQPYHRRHVKRYLHAVLEAMQYLFEHVGIYPYSNLTMIDPPTSAAGAGGMEYPQLITLGTHWLIPAGFRLPEMVAIHEYGHQYWYGMVASNEFEDPWLDEGINTYYETKIMDEAFGERGSAVDFLGIQVSDAEMQWSEYLRGAALDPIHRAAWQFYDSGSYSANSYSKTALMLRTLENYLGQATMEKIMRAYFLKWRFKHPATRDFVDVANQVSGQNLDWFFRQFLYSAGRLDYAVASVSDQKVVQDSLPALPGTVFIHATRQDSLVHELKVKIRKEGSWIFPQKIRIFFKNGDREDLSWDGKAPWRKWVFRSKQPVASVQLNPQQKVWLDENEVNDSWVAREPREAKTQVSARWLFWIQNIFQLISMAN